MASVMEFIAALGALTAFYALLRRDLGEVKRDLESDIARVETRVDAGFDRLDAKVGRVDAKIDLVRGELIAHLAGGTPPAA
jgi:hypothetical protein